MKANVFENVAELRRVLGSVERPLSLGGLARILNDADGRARNASTIQRWEEGAEPDYASVRLMASLAGIPFEQFALGRSVVLPPAPVPVIDREGDVVRPSVRRLAKRAPTGTKGM